MAEVFSHVCQLIELKEADYFGLAILQGDQSFVLFCCHVMYGYPVCVAWQQSARHSSANVTVYCLQIVGVCYHLLTFDTVNLFFSRQLLAALISEVFCFLCE